MLRAHGQAQQYARALPADEGRPPFLMVTDVGRYIGLYAEFSRTGATYVPFPDPRSHHIRLEDLRLPEVHATLRAVWTDPLSLDPARRSARVTRAIATDLAQLACSLEQAGHGAETTDSGRLPWPKSLTEQVQALRQALAAEPAPADAEQLARRFRRAQTRRVTEILDTLVALGQARSPEPGKYAV